MANGKIVVADSSIVHLKPYAAPPADTTLTKVSREDQDATTDDAVGRAAGCTGYTAMTFYVRSRIRSKRVSETCRKPRWPGSEEKC
eukprot:6512288-Prymnesium_polylepis.1